MVKLAELKFLNVVLFVLETKILVSKFHRHRTNSGGVMTPTKSG